MFLWDKFIRIYNRLKNIYFSSLNIDFDNGHFSTQNIRKESYLESFLLSENLLKILSSFVDEYKIVQIAKALVMELDHFINNPLLVIKT